MISQTPWIERSFDFNFPAGLFPVILERLRGSCVQLENIVNTTPESILETKPAQGWSAKEIIGHLGDLEDLWITRIHDFMAGKEVLTAADMSNDKTNQSGHHLKPVSSLLQRFLEKRRSLINLVKDADLAMAMLTALHPRLNKPMRLVDSLFFAAEHDDHELTRIRRLLDAGTNA